MKIAAVGLLLSMALGFQSAAATQIGLNLDWQYAENAKINTGKAVLFTSDVDNPHGITVAVNAGHGTKGGTSVKTMCHPDGSPKVTGGTTKKGATEAVAVSTGTTFSDGTAEAAVNLEVAHVFAKKLLEDGYDVLMIRENEDIQLDNIARTVIANNKADCHVAIHFDSEARDKGAFFMAVPDALKSMEPVASNWEKHEKLGSCLVQGLQNSGIKIFSNGSIDMDLTQTSYSTIPSVDVELGDQATDHSEGMISRMADGLLNGINLYYGFG